MTRIATILAALVAVLTLGVGPAEASKRATWHQPPAPESWAGLHDIYGSNHDGYMVGNDMYARRHVVLFQYCEGETDRARDAFACQDAWFNFYTYLRANRDGTKADWIELQHP